MQKYTVSLLGAGPGDPELLTVKALKRIQDADVLLYDALIDKRILAEAKADCIQIYAGKKFKDGQNPMLRQESIHEKMKNFHAQGLKVVRLKAGDPMIFGRGMEEIRYLENAQIPWEMVPGISAANAASAIFALPLTERGKSRMVLFTSGYTASGDAPNSDPYLNVLHEGGSVVFYMGLSKLPHLLKEIAHANLGFLNVAIANQISQKGQHLVKGTTATILDLLNKQDLKGPSLVVFGKHL